MTRQRPLMPTRALLTAALIGALGVTVTTLLPSAGPAEQVIVDPVEERAVSNARALAKAGEWAAATELLRPIADRGSASAQLEYGVLLARGWGVDRDLDKAREYLLLAVQSDFDDRGRAAYELGRLYRKSHGADCQRIAFEWFTKALDWGFAKAHSELGKSHRSGLGVVSDPARAIGHYRAAVMAGSASAVLPLLQVSALDGSHGNADARSVFAEFRPQIEKEAESGNGLAARTLARILRDGEFADRDLTGAVHWFTQAATLGDAAAMHDLAVLRLERGGETAEQDVDLLRESAARGYAGAMTALGRLHLSGAHGLKRDEAIQWFEKGVAAGHAGAMEELGNLFLHGRLVKADPVRARHFATQGARLGHAGSAKLLEELSKTDWKRPQSPSAEIADGTAG